MFVHLFSSGIVFVCGTCVLHVTVSIVRVRDVHGTLDRHLSQKPNQVFSEPKHKPDFNNSIGTSLTIMFTVVHARLTSTVGLKQSINSSTVHCLHCGYVDGCSTNLQLIGRDVDFCTASGRWEVSPHLITLFLSSVLRFSPVRLVWYPGRFDINKPASCIRPSWQQMQVLPPQRQTLCCVAFKCGWTCEHFVFPTKKFLSSPRSLEQFV